MTGYRYISIFGQVPRFIDFMFLPVSNEPAMALAPCPAAEQLKAWQGAAAEGTVVEGQAYGPVDYVCRKQVKYVRRCGHHVKLSCEQAFQYAPQPGDPTRWRKTTSHLD